MSRKGSQWWGRRLIKSTAKVWKDGDQGTVTALEVALILTLTAIFYPLLFFWIWEYFCVKHKWNRTARDMHVELPHCVSCPIYCRHRDCKEVLEVEWDVFERISGSINKGLRLHASLAKVLLCHNKKWREWTVMKYWLQRRFIYGLAAKKNICKSIHLLIADQTASRPKNAPRDHLKAGSQETFSSK